MASTNGYSDEQRQQAMLALQYADSQGCFLISGDEVRPVLPLLIANDGLEGVKRSDIIAALDAAIARGCDINQPDINGLSALNTAILLGNIELTQYLIKHGADPKQKILIDEQHDLHQRDSAALIDLLSTRDPKRGNIWQQLRKAISARD